VTHFLNWLGYILIGWAAISVIAIPFVGHFLSHHLHETAEDENERDLAEMFLPSHPETATGTGLQAGRFCNALTVSESGSSSETSITKRS
jgi:hypothetical protein